MVSVRRAYRRTQAVRSPTKRCRTAPRRLRTEDGPLLNQRQSSRTRIRAASPWRLWVLDGDCRVSRVSRLWARVGARAAVQVVRAEAAIKEVVAIAAKEHVIAT